MRDKKAYHYEKKNRANVSAMLRALVAAYIVYLGYSATPLHAEPDGMSAGVAWLLGGALMLAGVAVLVYTALRYKRDLAAAEYTEEEYEALERGGDEGEDK